MTLFLKLFIWKLLFACSLQLVVLGFQDIVSGRSENRVNPVTVVSGHWVLEARESKHPIGSYHKWYCIEFALLCYFPRI